MIETDYVSLFIMVVVGVFLAKCIKKVFCKGMNSAKHNKQNVYGKTLTTLYHNGKQK